MLPDRDQGAGRKPLGVWDAADRAKPGTIPGLSLLEGLRLLGAPMGFQVAAGGLHPW